MRSHIPILIAIGLLVPFAYGFGRALLSDTLQIDFTRAEEGFAIALCSGFWCFMVYTVGKLVESFFK